MAREGGGLAKVSLARVTKININSLCQCIRQSDSWPEKVLTFHTFPNLNPHYQQRKG